MPLTQTLSSFRFPVVGQETLTCVGVRLGEDASAWIQAALPHVTESERANAERFVHAVDAARHLVGRAIVRRTLGATLRRPFSADFSYTPWGKPFLPHENIDFSITHSGDWVWTAFYRPGAVGIDVEHARPMPDIPELAAMLHPEEREAILGVPPSGRAAAFYRCWTRKEAVLKAIGMGLNLPLDSFQVHTSPEETDWIISAPQAKALGQAARPRLPRPSAGKERDSLGWTAHDLPVGPGYHCSVAAHGPRPRLEVLLIPDAQRLPLHGGMTISPHRRAFPQTL